MRQHVPPQQLWNEFHGDLEFEYDHEVYWPTLLKLCEEKHREQHARWVQGGKQYGESENYIKGGSSPSIGLKVAATTEDTSVLPTVPDFAGESAEALGKGKEIVPAPAAEVKSSVDSNEALTNGKAEA